MFSVLRGIRIGNKSSVEAIRGYYGTVQSTAWEGSGCLPFIRQGSRTGREGCSEDRESARFPLEQGPQPLNIGRRDGGRAVERMEKGVSGTERQQGNYRFDIGAIKSNMLVTVQ